MKKPTPAQIKKALQENKSLKCMPQKGTPFIIFKKVRHTKKDAAGHYYLNPSEAHGAILALYIPASADRVCVGGGGNRYSKLRVSDAYVISATRLGGKAEKGKVFLPLYTREHYAKGFIWEVGKWHKPAKRFLKSEITCASGLHGFISRKRATEYS